MREQTRVRAVPGDDGPPGGGRGRRGRRPHVEIDPAELQARFRQTRGRLIDKGLAPRNLREPISDSWLRSVHLGLDPERLHPRFEHELNDDTRLVRTADVVLTQVAEELFGEPVSIILADAQGNVLRRHCSDAFLRRHLDGAQLDTGFSYHEDCVGTNGIGTTLERGIPTLVYGGEHYTDQLVTFSCAGSPVHHPVQGSVLGVVDLTSLAQHASPVLLAYARSVAHRIEQEMLSDVSSRDLALLSEYRVASQRTGGPVMALSADLVMMNQQAQQRFDTVDRAALLARSQDVVEERAPRTLIVELPSGLVARLDYRPCLVGDRLVGGVFRISTVLADQPAPGGPAARSTASPSSRALPLLAGTSAVWQHTCRTVLAHQDTREWIVLEGEVGSGKLALARAAHQWRRTGDHLRVIEAPSAPGDEADWLAAVEEELGIDDGTIVLHRVDRLEAPLVSAVAALLHEQRDRSVVDGRPWVVATMLGQPRNQEVDAQLVPIFAHTVTVPPLRHHMEDLPQLVPALLARTGRGGGLSMSAPALRQLLRLPWPGNVAQLARVLRQIAQRRRGGEIGLEDLPPECLGGSRRQLTPLEALERDAIVAALIASGGNKLEAATSLGMSRATIYRKIREYGVTWQDGT